MMLSMYDNELLPQPIKTLREKTKSRTHGEQAERVSAARKRATTIQRQAVYKMYIWNRCSLNPKRPYANLPHFCNPVYPSNRHSFPSSLKPFHKAHAANAFASLPASRHILSTGTSFSVIFSPSSRSPVSLPVHSSSSARGTRRSCRNSEMCSSQAPGEGNMARGRASVSCCELVSGRASCVKSMSSEAGIFRPERLG